MNQVTFSIYVFVTTVVTLDSLLDDTINENCAHIN